MLVLALLAAVMLLAIPTGAGAVELYADQCAFPPCPPHVVHHPPPPPHVIVVPPPVVVAPPVPAVYVAPAPVALVEHVAPAADEGKKGKPKVDVEIDGGLGMWIVPKLRQQVSLAYDVRASLLVKDVVMTLSFNWVPSVKWDGALAETGEETVEKGNLGLVGLGFGYRWNKKGHIHPQVGVGFDALFLDRDRGSTVYAFGVGGSLGLLGDFPLPYGALMGGVQAGASYQVWRQGGFYPPRTTVSVMALVGYRF